MYFFSFSFFQHSSCGNASWASISTKADAISKPKQWLPVAAVLSCHRWSTWAGIHLIYESDVVIVLYPKIYEFSSLTFTHNNTALCLLFEFAVVLTYMLRTGGFAGIGETATQPQLAAHSFRSDWALQRSHPAQLDAVTCVAFTWTQTHRFRMASAATVVGMCKGHTLALHSFFFPYRVWVMSNCWWLCMDLYICQMAGSKSYSGECSMVLIFCVFHCILINHQIGSWSYSKCRSSMRSSTQCWAYMVSHWKALKWVTTVTAVAIIRFVSDISLVSLNVIMFVTFKYFLCPVYNSIKHTFVSQAACVYAYACTCVCKCVYVHVHVCMCKCMCNLHACVCGSSAYTIIYNISGQPNCSYLLFFVLFFRMLLPTPLYLLPLLCTHWWVTYENIWFLFPQVERKLFNLILSLLALLTLLISCWWCLQKMWQPLALRCAQKRLFSWKSQWLSCHLQWAVVCCL